MLALVKKKLPGTVGLFCNRTREFFPDLRTDVRESGDLGKLRGGKWRPPEIRCRNTLVHSHSAKRARQATWLSIADRSVSKSCLTGNGTAPIVSLSLYQVAFVAVLAEIG